MLTDEELATLESLLARARAVAGHVRYETGGTVNVGDLVQLRPGADFAYCPQCHGKNRK